MRPMIANPITPTQVVEVMRIMRQHDTYEGLFWHVDGADAPVTLYALCNDVFGPGSDCEPIESRVDIERLRYAFRAAADAMDGGEVFGFELYVARRRDRCPWDRFFRAWDDGSKLEALFRECGNGQP